MIDYGFKKLASLIGDLIKERFWGILEIRFEEGRVVFIRKTEHIKP